MDNWDPFRRNLKEKANYRVPRPSKENKIVKLNKMKIFCKLLRDNLNRILQLYFAQLKNNTNQKYQKLSKVIQYSQANHLVCKGIAFRFFQNFAKYTKNNEKKMKRVVVLSHRINTECLSAAFSRLYQYSQRKKEKDINHIVQIRGQLLSCSLIRIFKARKRSAFKKLQQYSRFQKLAKKKFRIMGLIMNRITKNSKKIAFKLILKKAKKKMMSKKSKPSDFDDKSQKLRLQIDDMAVKIGNKEQNIQRLTQQIQLFRKKMKENHENSEFYQKKLDISYDQRSLSAHGRSSKRSMKDSMVSQDYSIGSVLGSSFISIRSGSAFQSAMDCNCKYKYKYYDYKSQHQSLKNQLDILKKELEVSKDLNEHFQNELKFYGEIEENQQLEKLKQELKEAQKDRNILRQKVLKSQKNLNQFRIKCRAKLQQIYKKAIKQA